MSTRRERLTRKLEKRGEWADKARTRSDAAFGSAGQMAEAIPFGQPVLIGHHSEKRDRAYRGRMHAKMDRGVAEHRKAEHHASKARGLSIALEASIFDDDPDALEKLREKMAALEAVCENMKRVNAAWKKGGREAVAQLTSEALAAEIERNMGTCRKGRPFEAYQLSNRRAEIRRCKQRIANIEAKQKRASDAEKAGGVVVARHGETGLCRVTFVEKPARDVLEALRAAGYHWGLGSWHGRIDELPDAVRALEEQAKAEAGECLCSTADAYECATHEAEREQSEPESFEPAGEWRIHAGPIVRIV